MRAIWKPANDWLVGIISRRLMLMCGGCVAIHMNMLASRVEGDVENDADRGFEERSQPFMRDGHAGPRPLIHRKGNAAVGVRLHHNCAMN